MAPEYDIGMGFGGLEAAAATAVSSPYYSHHHHHHSSSSHVGTAAGASYQLYGMPPVEALRIDDLLDFPASQEGGGGGMFGGEASSSSSGYYGAYAQQQVPYYGGGAGGAASSHSSGFPGGNGGGYYGGGSLEGDSSRDGHRLFTLPEDIFVPREEEAELEWLSKFMEEDSTSFACNLFPPGTTFGAAVSSNAGAGKKSSATNGADNNNQQLQQNARANGSVPGRARSKRSRVPAGGGGGGAASHLANAGTAWSSSATLIPPACATTALQHQPQQSPSGGGGGSGSSNNNNNSYNASSPPSPSSSTDAVRRCTHCLSEKTPQWRMGPMGPKTLCNACGVRYKSGRLVPEYRPAASPTFVLTQHSNSHRKVLELRRQKELLIRHNQASPSSSPVAAHFGAGAPHFEVR